MESVPISLWGSGKRGFLKITIGKSANNKYILLLNRFILKRHRWHLSKLLQREVVQLSALLLLLMWVREVLHPLCHQPRGYYPVWSNESSPAGDYFCHRTPKLTKSALFVPALTHSGVWNAQQRARRVNTDAGTLSELWIKTALSSACAYELSALVLTPLLWRHDGLSLQRFLPSSPLPLLSCSFNTFSCDWGVNFCLIWMYMLTPAVVVVFMINNN